MTIRVKKDSIEFVSDEGTTYTLKETGDGFSFDGVIEGTNIFQDGFPGNFFGFSGSGNDPPSTPPRLIHSIEKFSFATNSNAANHGDLLSTDNNSFGTSVSGKTSGYFTGGSNPNTDVTSNFIQKFLFVTNANAVDIGDLTVSRAQSAGQSSSTSGYTSGGNLPPSAAQVSNTIDKFPFASDASASDVGDLITAIRASSGQSSSISGYNSGGYASPSSRLNTITKFPFSTDTNASDVGDLTGVDGGVSARSAGHSSFTFGYQSAGNPGNGVVNSILKFPFSSDSNATDVGDLTETRDSQSGSSSTINGFTSAGSIPGTGKTNTIDKFPFATDTNASDHGDLTTSRNSSRGWQH